ncbi:MAG TPA: IS3 family transposase [Solirubrobacteraceae bacterium]|nr:IS3 family transposase [Solirubrobacteraceae bacterium]
MARPKKYPDELIARGVRLALESERPIAHIAADLGMHPETLRKKVRQAEADSGARPELTSSSEREELKRLRRENYELRRANEILKSASVFFCQGARRGPDEVSRYIDGYRGRFGVEPICRTLEVSASAYYQRKTGWRSARAVDDERLLEKIRKVHVDNYEAYGYRRTWKALGRAGEQVPRCQVQRLMAAHGIRGAKRRGRPWKTTRPDPLAHRRPDLVERDFTASAPNELWVADLTYLRCWEGVVFFSFVIDVYSRRIVGWQFASHMRTDLVLDALRMALGRRGPGADVELVHHSDRGSQYTSIDYTQTLADHGVLASVGSVGDAYDNALAESFVDSFKTELIADRVWRTRSQLELAIVEYVGWFNDARLHEALGDLPPAEFETLSQSSYGPTIPLMTKAETN